MICMHGCGDGMEDWGVASGLGVVFKEINMMNID